MKTPKEFFFSQSTTNASVETVDVNNQRFNHFDLFKFAELYSRYVMQESGIHNMSDLNPKFIESISGIEKSLKKK